MTYTRSGNALATSSTLLKYCTGSFISRSCSSSLNCPKTHDKRKRCEMFTLDSCHRGDSIPPSFTPTLLCQRLLIIILGGKSYHGRRFSSTRICIKESAYRWKNNYKPFLFHLLFTPRVCYPMTKIKRNAWLSVIGSQSENLLCYKWWLILFFPGITLAFSGN